MDLSIVIPTYNRVNLIVDTLNSLASKYHPHIDYEIIVVDDQSTDNTLQFISDNYPNVVLLKNDGKGAAMGRNTGLKNARGKYLCYLDSDDLIGENYFYEKIRLLNDNSTITACYGTYEYFRLDSGFNDESIIFKHKYPIIEQAGKDPVVNKHLINYLRGAYIPQNAFVWRKDFLQKIGGHAPALTINQDVELCIRALMSGAVIAGLNDGTNVYVRDHNTDERVGTISNKKKYAEILQLRKDVFARLRSAGFDNDQYGKALSLFLFNQWRKIRHVDNALAADYLSFAKTIYWPIQMEGGKAFEMISKVLGPVLAVRLKYLFFKRDV